MAKEIIFRLAEPTDAANILQLLKQLQTESDTFLVDSDLTSLTPDVEAQQIKLINQSLTNLMALAVLNDQLIGIVTVDGLTREVGEVGIAVLKAYQGFTIGTNLMALAIDWATDYSQLSTLTLEVFKDNQVAIHLYRKMGFKLVKTKVDHDRMVLEMSLTIADKSTKKD